jgi:NADH-quinone oxidoreductase subunit I
VDRAAAIYTKEMLLDPVKLPAKPTPQKVTPGKYTRSVPEMKDPID